jgi:mannose-6-phosphate isomerase
LGSILGKPIGPEPDYAESWELCDRGADQSVVACGPLAGQTLHELVGRHAAELFGPHARPRFPLLLKHLDATQTLSVQVHPDDARAARLDPPDLGKTEAWVVIEAAPGSLVYAGLKPGVDRAQLAAAIAAGRCAGCLHRFAPQPGDCIFLPAGAVHALGAGLLVAEIQQSSDTTYRLFDWNRVGPDGQPRALHVAAGLDTVDFALGPIGPQVPQPTAHPACERLVACQPFVLDRWRLAGKERLGGDGRFHILSVLAGAVRVEGDPCHEPLPRGGAILLPASLGPCAVVPEGEAILLDARLS